MNWAAARFRFVRIIHEMSETCEKVNNSYLYKGYKRDPHTVYSKGHICWMEPRQPSFSHTWLRSLEQKITNGCWNIWSSVRLLEVESHHHVFNTIILICLPNDNAVSSDFVATRCDKRRRHLHCVQAQTLHLLSHVKPGGCKSWHWY